MLRKHTPALADSIVLEQGKTVAGERSRAFIRCPDVQFNVHADARGDVHRGLQVVETAMGITSTLLGDHIEGMSL